MSEKLKRVLSFSDVVAYGLLYFVPMAPIAVFGFIYNMSNGMVALTYLVTALAMIFSAVSYSEMAKKIPLSGSVYSYVSKGVNPFFGFIAGWAILLDYLLLPALLAVLGAAALETYVPSVDKSLWIVLFVAVPMVVNLFGIQMSARLSKILLCIQLAILAIFAVVACTKIFSYGLTTEMLLSPIYNAGNFSMTAVFAGVSIAALSFIGFDAVSTLNEEAKGGGETVSKATLFLLVVVTLLFVAQVYFAAIFVPIGTVFTGAEVEGAFYNISAAIVGEWFLPVITLGSGIVAILANALVSQATTSKVIFNMARDNRLPHSLSKLNSKSAPYRSIIIVAILSFIIALVGLNHIDRITTLVTFGALTAYIMLNITVVLYFRNQTGRHTFKHIVSPVLGAMILGVSLWNAEMVAKIMGCSWIIIGIVVTWLLRKANKLNEIELDV